MPPVQMLTLIGKVAGSVLSSFIPPAKRWWKRFAFPAASTKRMSVLVARVAGDNSAYSNQNNIREAIRDALPEVEVHIWHEEWQLPDGEDRTAQAAAYKTARRWLDAKKCDLLIAGRMKSESVISLRFIPAIGASSSDDPTTRSLTYAFAADTMDLPAKFANDVASSLGASIIVHLKTRRASGEVLQALVRLTAQLQTVIDAAPALSDARIKASLINSYSVARAFIFEFSGNLEDLRVAMNGLLRACGTLNKQDNLLEWSQSRSNYGAALARLGGITNDTEMLLQAIAAMKEGVPGLTSDLVRWGKVQLFLASAYLEVARVRGSMEYLSASLDVCLQVISQELHDKEPGLWAAAQDQYGRGLATLGDAQAGTEAFFRSVDAFTDALEVWTGTNPEMQAVTLVNLSATFIALGTRQGSLDWFNDTVTRLREAQSLVSKRHHLRLWLAVQINLGICLSLAAETEPAKYKEAVSVLRHAQPLVPKFDIQLSSRLSLALAKALMFSGSQREIVSEIKESISIFEELLKITDPALQREIKNNLGLAYCLLGVASEDIQCLEISRDILSDLVQNAAATFPFTRAQSQQCLGRTLREIGRLKRSASIVRASIEQFAEGLAFASEGTAPAFAATVYFHLASSYLELARLDKATSSLALAQEHVSKALLTLGPNARGALPTAILKLAEDIREFGDNDPSFQRPEN
jgi:tetratricopeptide (TPR) repeat protein